MASDTSSSNVALSGASGATSRWIGFAAGALFILLGFSPKLGAILSVMPSPVAGAIVVFVVCFMLVSGLQIILSHKPDTRKIFVIGIALCFGLSLDVLPQLYAQVPPWLRPLFEFLADLRDGDRGDPEPASSDRREARRCIRVLVGMTGAEHRFPLGRSGETISDSLEHYPPAHAFVRGIDRHRRIGRRLGGAGAWRCGGSRGG